MVAVDKVVAPPVPTVCRGREDSKWSQYQRAAHLQDYYSSLLLESECGYCFSPRWHQITGWSTSQDLLIHKKYNLDELFSLQSYKTTTTFKSRLQIVFHRLCLYTVNKYLTARMLEEFCKVFHVQQTNILGLLLTMGVRRCKHYFKKLADKHLPLFRYLVYIKLLTFRHVFRNATDVISQLLLPCDSVISSTQLSVCQWHI